MDDKICHSITDDLIPEDGIVVMDWDNTLKIYDHVTRQISSRVAKETLERWKFMKRCKIFIISAIRPSKMNLETLLFELEKVGLTEIFISEKDEIQIVAGKYARKGNVVICGYDKAETFLLLREEMNRADDTRDIDAADDLETDGVDSADCCRDSVQQTRDNVVFFDDEEVNVINFAALVADSKCYLVQ